jgi:hypothetical protein
LDFHDQVAKRRLVTLRNRIFSPVTLALLLLLAGAGVVFAQLEGGERGVPPIDSASTYEVTGINVDVVAPTADAARYEGWREAQLKGWQVLWAKVNNRPVGEAPKLADSVLNSIVSAVSIEQEQIGPTRYIATLGILFDRSRAGPMLGGIQGEIRRSVPMLIIPVMQTGSTFQSFESRSEWQRAWARFRTGNSPVDYIRPVGSGIDPLLLNVEQAGRPGRGWWRMLLDQYGATDILVPEVQLKHFYPGGPVIGVFTGRHGPDNRLLVRFGLRVERSALIPKLLDEGVRRLDAAYSAALQQGMLAPDPSLNAVMPLTDAIADQIEKASAALTEPETTAPVPVGPASTFSIQVDTPTSASVGQAELSVSRIRGVTSALTTSLALGGTSVMRVTFAGDASALQAALQAQGWSTQVSGSTIRISRPDPGNR